MDNRLVVPQGTFILKRHPQLTNQQLRAWDAADEYILQHLADHHLIVYNEKVLIVNDEFGALTLPLAHLKPHLYSDSYLARHNVQANLALNGFSDDSVQFITSIERPDVIYDIIIVKIPKYYALLEHQLCQLRHNISSATLFIAAGMSKNIHSSTLQFFERLIGPTTTSHARKKARLIFSSPQMEVAACGPPYPSTYSLPEYDLIMHNHANVFSAKKLDIGTRFFLEHLPKNSCFEKVIDLGCGNGALGIVFALNNPQAEVTFIDESYMAVESARLNFNRAMLTKFSGNGHKGDRSTASKAAFIPSDCLTGIAPNSADLILNNPPFHQNNIVDDHIAWKMFHQAQTVLRKNGELWVVGNRHLGYHTKLKRLFGNCNLIASNSKFVVLQAKKS